MHIREILYEMPAFALKGTANQSGSNTYIARTGDKPFGDRVAFGDKIGGSPGYLKVDAYPSNSTDKSSAYDTHEDMIANFDNLNQLSGGKYSSDTVNWINKDAGLTDKAYKGFVVTPIVTTEPEDQKGTVHYIGKFVSDTKQAETGKNSSGSNVGQKKSYKAGPKDFDTNELAKFGYYSSHKNGEKPGEAQNNDAEADITDIFSISSVKPADFPNLSTSPDNLQTPDQVLAAIESRLTNQNPLYQLAVKVKNGSKPFEVTVAIPEGADRNAINDLKGRFNKISTDFGEVLQPLAFCSDTIQNDNLKVNNRKNGRISYTAVTGPGNDSIVVAGKDTVKISTKSASDKGQASAPYVGGLLQTLQSRPDLQKKYPTEYQALVTLGTGNPEPGKGGSQGVLSLAVPGLLSQADVDYITKTMYPKRDIVDPEEFTDMPDSIRALLPNPYPIHKNRGTGSSVYYVLNNNLMKLLSRELNYKDGKFNSKMSELIGDLLAEEKIITVMTVPTFEVKGNELVYSIEFKARPVGDPAKNGSPAYLINGHGTFNDGARATLSYTVGKPGEFPPAPGATVKRAPKQKEPIQMANPDLFSIGEPEEPPVQQQPAQAPAPTVNPQVQQQTIQALKTPGSPLNQALLAIKDPTERAEAEEEALGNINAGQDDQAVLARLQSWLAEANELKRLKQLIKY